MNLDCTHGNSRLEKEPRDLKIRKERIKNAKSLSLTITLGDDF